MNKWKHIFTYLTLNSFSISGVVWELNWVDRIHLHRWRIYTTTGWYIIHLNMSYGLVGKKKRKRKSANKEGKRLKIRKKGKIFTVPRRKKYVLGNRGRGKNIIFLVNNHPCTTRTVTNSQKVQIHALRTKSKTVGHR